MFSKELEQSIASLFDQAQDQNLEYLTIAVSYTHLTLPTSDLV